VKTKTLKASPPLAEDIRRQMAALNLTESEVREPADVVYDAFVVAYRARKPGGALVSCADVARSVKLSSTTIAGAVRRLIAAGRMYKVSRFVFIPKVV
jgi:hypothetical protein